MGKHKHQNLNRARNMDIDAWRERKINQRLKARLTEETSAFVAEHGEDTDEALRAYVLAAAKRKGRMPHPLEIPGGVYLSKRLGDWSVLSWSLGYTPVRGEYGKRVYRRLWEQEAEAFAAERRAKKLALEKKRGKYFAGKQ